MAEHRFDGRAGVVTGAGRGIGRAYARLLAARGASVVLNDLGSSMSGKGSDAGPAATAVEEITAAGGVAVADTHDVSIPEGAQAIVATALERFGRIDFVINNAGIMRWLGPPELTLDVFERHLAVHLHGSLLTSLAAWPHFTEQGYGRIVMTASTGMLGLPTNTSYAAAKAGVVGLTRSLAVAGAPLGIKVNVIAPAAATRMGGDPTDGQSDGPMAPDLVAPMTAYLAHEDCPVTGEIYTAGAGRFARLFIASTEGYVHVGGKPTIEDVAAQWATINDEAGYFVPADLMAWSERFLAHQAGDDAH